MECVDDGVDLDAVAGGQHHRLGDQRGLQHVVDDLGLIGLIGAELLQDGHRRAAVRNPEKQYAHGSITTSSTVVVNQLGYQICPILRRHLRGFCAWNAIPAPGQGEVGPQPGLVDLPVTVFSAVQQHHREAGRRTRRAGPVGRRQQLPSTSVTFRAKPSSPASSRQPRRRGQTHRASLAREQLHLPVHPVSIAIR